MSKGHRRAVFMMMPFWDDRESGGKPHICARAMTGRLAMCDEIRFEKSHS